MLVVPFAAGMLAAQPSWLHLLFFAGWLLAYLFSYPALQWVKTGKKERYGKPVAVYAVLLAVTGAALLWLRPQLIFYALALIPFSVVNIYYARRNRERAFWNGIIAIIQFCTVVYPAYALGGGSDWYLASGLALVCFLYFAGTVFYVKTIIREKNNPAYYRASVGYHMLLVVLSAWLLPYVMLIPALILLARAVVCPRMGISVKQTGIMEIGISAMVLISVLTVLV
jgi:hypothetical protein